MSRPSTCRASTHVARMRAGTVGQWERTWKSVAAMLAHGASRPARCSIPRRCPSHSSRSTYAARSQLSGGDLTPDKVSNTLRDEGSMASTVSASDARMRRSDVFLRFVPESNNPTPYLEPWAGLESRASVRAGWTNRQSSSLNEGPGESLRLAWRAVSRGF